MADLDHIHAAIANLYPGAGFSAYIWGQPNGEDGKPEGEPAMLLWDEERFGPFNMEKVLAECRRLAQMPDAQPVPATVEDWQFAGQAAEEGIITRPEALDWSGAGIVPPTLVKAVDRLITDEDQHFKVMIFLRGSKAYPRAHSLVPLLGRVFGKADDAALDAFWIAAAQR